MSQTRSEVTDSVLLNEETGWPVGLDPEAGPDGVPFGRFRRCLDCRGSGVLQGEPCALCGGIPYVDGSLPNHWCASCEGRRTNCAVAWYSCPGPPSVRDKANADLAEDMYNVEQDLAELRDHVEENKEDPARMLETHHKLYVLATRMYGRSMADPRLDPDTRAEYDGRHYVVYE